ncbi:unnamed protein product [Caenorhabditis angaria]|uniref:Uncharacterized protein n=1 Tax=Caenorhabditis angaria TaxID=860376 RepID=A0A9P1IZS7_9PELO|nr:unnamed protein product [Caenorhabditis angaria]
MSNSFENAQLAETGKNTQRDLSSQNRQQELRGTAIERVVETQHEVAPPPHSPTPIDDKEAEYAEFDAIWRNFRAEQAAIGRVVETQHEVASPQQSPIPIDDKETGYAEFDAIWRNFRAEQKQSPNPSENMDEQQNCFEFGEIWQNFYAQQDESQESVEIADPPKSPTEDMGIPVTNIAEIKELLKIFFAHSRSEVPVATDAPQTPNTNGEDEGGEIVEQLFNESSAAGHDENDDDEEPEIQNLQTLEFSTNSRNSNSPPSSVESSIREITEVSDETTNIPAEDMNMMSNAHSDADDFDFYDVYNYEEDAPSEDREDEDPYERLARRRALRRGTPGYNPPARAPIPVFVDHGRNFDSDDEPLSPIRPIRGPGIVIRSSGNLGEVMLTDDLYDADSNVDLTGDLFMVRTNGRVPQKRINIATDNSISLFVNGKCYDDIERRIRERVEDEVRSSMKNFKGIMVPRECYGPLCRLWNIRPTAAPPTQRPTRKRSSSSSTSPTKRPRIAEAMDLAAPTTSGAPPTPTSPIPNADANIVLTPPTILAPQLVATASVVGVLPTPTSTTRQSNRVPQVVATAPASVVGVLPTPTSTTRQSILVPHVATVSASVVAVLPTPTPTSSPPSKKRGRPSKSNSTVAKIQKPAAKKVHAMVLRSDDANQQLAPSKFLKSKTPILSIRDVKRIMEDIEAALNHLDFGANKTNLMNKLKELRKLTKDYAIKPSARKFTKLSAKCDSLGTCIELYAR